jgi:hypothetical protein
MPETALADVLNFVKKIQTHPFEQIKTHSSKI